MDSQFCTVEEALEELRAGHLIITIDDPDRENEGDLICAAQFATTENVNFMAVHAKGLICTPMSAEIAGRLGLEQMVKVNTDNHSTAFTVSIDHVDTTTGISAEERGYTCRKCVDPATRPEDLRRPGHVFPLVARRGGVLVRSGHTEATVDLCRLAGLAQCGLCCEIMRDDGTMMRTTELLEKAKEWGLKVLTIQALQDYCRRHDKHVVREAAAKMPTKYGNFRIFGYVNDLTGEHHVALVKGDIGDGENVLCRVHSECLTGDVFGSKRCDCGEQLAAAMRQIEAEMKRRGIAPLSAQRQKAKTIPMWGRRAASVAAVLVCGVCLWQLLEQQQPDTHQLARQPSESGGAESAGHSFKSGQTEDHTLQLPAVSSGRLLASFVARKGGPERSKKRVVVADLPNAGEGTQVAVSPDGRMETEGGKRGNDSATPKTNSATKPGTDTRKPREWAEPEEKRRRFGGETGGSRFCVSTAYGGSVGTSNGVQGILLASAEPIGDYDREFSGGNTRKDITGSDEVRTETKHRQPVKFGVSVRYSIDGR